MPQIEPKFTLGNIATIITIVLSLLGGGAALGAAYSEIATLKETQIQLMQDSRTLIRLQADVSYIKQAVDEMRQ